jgi:hypothetical protein
MERFADEYKFLDFILWIEAGFRNPEVGGPASG